jgi:hypothetical protein
MISVKLQGGLGNQLFQLAFLDYIGKITGKETYLQDINSPKTIHSKEKYFENIFKNWKSKFFPRGSYLFYENPKLEYEDWKSKLNVPSDVCVMGYFQRYEYIDSIRNEFIKKLIFNTGILEKYQDIQNKFFIHIRGGDYKNNYYHDVGLINYYKKCMELCNNEEFVIFTNDIPYAKDILPNIEIIEECEIDSLYLMTKTKGCICANSSFSWWGAYLNPDRPIYMPSKWYNDLSMKGNYYFKGVQVIDINV